MKIVLIALGCIVVLVGVAVAGLELFSVYPTSLTINNRAPVQTTKRITIKASPVVIWTIMSRIDEWATWHKDVQSPTLKEAFRTGASFNWKSGGLNIHSTIHTAIPYSKIGWSGRAFGAFAIHNWTFTQLDGYTEVRVEESMEGWLVALMKNKFQSGLEQSLDTWLNNLKAEAERQ